MNRLAAFRASLLLLVTLTATAPCFPQVGWVSQAYGPGGVLAVAVLDSLDRLAVGFAGKMIRTTDGGFSWTELPNITANTLRSVVFLDQVRGAAVGDFGTILTTSDGGETWVQRSSGTLHDLRAVVRGGSALFAVGAVGTVLRSDDFGATWVPQVVPSEANLYAASFHDAQSGVAVGGFGNAQVFWTHDGGATWELRPVPWASPFFGVAATGTQTAFVAGGPGGAFRTDDGGNSWVPLPFSLDARVICFVDSVTGWIMGGGVVHTTDGGASWVHQWTPGNFVYGAGFFGRWIGSAACWSAFLHTSSGGSTNWTIQPLGTTARLNSIAFSDLSSGVIVGSGGTVLTSSDRGLTWIDRTLGGKSLNDVSPVGPGRYVAVGDSGTILVSEDGGTTWEPRFSGTMRDLLSVAFPSASRGFCCRSLRRCRQNDRWWVHVDA